MTRTNQPTKKFFIVLYIKKESTLTSSTFKICLCFGMVLLLLRLKCERCSNGLNQKRLKTRLQRIYDSDCEYVWMCKVIDEMNNRQEFDSTKWYDFIGIDWCHRELKLKIDRNAFVCNVHMFVPLCRLTMTTNKLD